MASVATRGRGIGRGRGFGIPKAGRPGETQTAAQQNNSSIEKSSDEFDLGKVLNDLKEDTLSTQVEKISQYISDSNSSTRIKEVVDLLTQRTIKNSEFAPLAAKFANKLCVEESFGNAFRADLLKSTQENYKKRESIREKSTSDWIGLVGLICELFNHLRTGGAPLKPLAGAVHQTMSELLREGPAGSKGEEEVDEVDCFYEHFKTVGQLLENVNQVEHLRNCDPHTWWKEVKTLGGTKSATRSDPMSVLRHIDTGLNSGPTTLANTINKAFLDPMSIFVPLAPDAITDDRHPNPPLVSVHCVFKKLSTLNPAKALGPDIIPSWLLKENTDLLAPVVTDIINCSFAEARLPLTWKHANIVPIPKQVPVYSCMT
ncbi:hypothetical protein ACROYT_G007583 [Oculina patagonica]